MMNGQTWIRPAMIPAGLFLLCVSMQPASAVDFIQDSTCGLVNPAFVEHFDAAHHGGIGGDLDESIWSVSRSAFMVNGAMSYYPADIPRCKLGAPLQAYPDSEILVCDNSIPGYAGRLMVPMAGQNYGLTAFRANQPFDFTNRTGIIAFDADATYPCGALGDWVSLELTAEPLPCVNFPRYEHGGEPKDGMLLEFYGCNSQIGLCYKDYVETLFSATDCVKDSAGFLNHYEVRVSRQHIEIWASDYSLDGKTFPNFKKIASTDFDFPFTKGYVSLGVNNHATIKYGCPKTGIHYFDNVGFDGPVLPADRVYSIPNASKLQSTGTLVDIEYLLPAAGSPVSFTFRNVDLTNATGAKVTLTTFLPYLPDPTTVKLVYRLNGGTWTDRPMTAGESGALLDNQVLPLVIPIPLAGLKQGDNTFELTSANGNGGYPPEVANIALSIGNTGGATTISSGRTIDRSVVSGNSFLVAATKRDGIISVTAGVPGRASIYNSAGVLLETLAVPAGATRFCTTRFSPGVRFVRFAANSGEPLQTLILQ